MSETNIPLKLTANELKTQIKMFEERLLTSVIGLDASIESLAINHGEDAGIKNDLTKKLLSAYYTNKRRVINTSMENLVIKIINS